MTTQTNYIQEIHTCLIDHSPLGFSWPMQQTTEMNLTARLRIPTGRRQTSWLCTSAAEELNQGLPRTNPASGQSGTWTRDLQISSPALSPLGHAASLKLSEHVYPSLSGVLCKMKLEFNRLLFFKWELVTTKLVTLAAKVQETQLIHCKPNQLKFCIKMF